MANAVRISVNEKDLKNKNNKNNVNKLIVLWKKKLKITGLIKHFNDKKYNITKGEKKRIMINKGKARAKRNQQGGQNDQD